MTKTSTKHGSFEHLAPTRIMLGRNPSSLWTVVDSFCHLGHHQICDVNLADYNHILVGYDVVLLFCWPCVRSEKYFYYQSQGCFTLWSKVKRLSISTTQIAKNQEFNILTLHIRGQSPRLLLFKMPTWQYFLTKATDSQMKFGSDGNGNPNYGREAVNFFPCFFNKNTDKILAIRLEGLFQEGNEVGCSFFMVWAWPLEASHLPWLKAPFPVFYWLVILNPLFWTLNKVWPFNPMASRLGRPQCETTLSIISQW